MSRPLLTAVVPCMGRLHHLRESIPALLASAQREGVRASAGSDGSRDGDLEVLLVDYACPDECGAYARAHWPAVRVVEVRGVEHFNKARALNAGVAAACGEWIAIVDADMVVQKRFVEIVRAQLAPGVVLGRADEDDGTGFIVVAREELRATGGYQPLAEGPRIAHLLVRDRGLAWLRAAEATDASPSRSATARVPTDSLRAAARALCAADLVVTDSAELLPLCAAIGVPTFVLGLAEQQVDPATVDATNLIFCEDVAALAVRLELLWPRASDRGERAVSSFPVPTS